jgi:hypothetical protein
MAVNRASKTRIVDSSDTPVSAVVGNWLVSMGLLGAKLNTTRRVVNRCRRSQYQVVAKVLEYNIL